MIITMRNNARRRPQGVKGHKVLKNAINIKPATAKPTTHKPDIAKMRQMVLYRRKAQRIKDLITVVLSLAIVGFLIWLVGFLAGRSW